MKATEQYFKMMLLIKLYKALWIKSWTVTIQMKAF